MIRWWNIGRYERECATALASSRWLQRLMSDESDGIAIRVRAWR